MKVIVLFLLMILSLRGFCQSFKDKLSEPHFIKKKELMKFIPKQRKYKYFYSTGNSYARDSTILFVIEAHAKNDTTYNIGMIFKNNTFIAMYEIPQSYRLNNEEIILGRMYSYYTENNCLMFVTEKIKPVNISKLENKFDFDSAIIVERQQLIYCDDNIQKP